MTTSPTARSMAWCRRLGLRAAVVERWNEHARIRQDLFKCVDVLALVPAILPGDGPGYETSIPAGVLAIQACAGASHAARVAKVRAAEALPDLIAAGVTVEVHSWTKKGAKNKRKTWTLRRERVVPELADSEKSEIVKRMGVALQKIPPLSNMVLLHKDDPRLSVQEPTHHVKAPIIITRGPSAVREQPA